MGLEAAWRLAMMVSCQAVYAGFLHGGA